MQVSEIMLSNRDQLRPQDSIRKAIELLKSSKPRQTTKGLNRRAYQ